MQYPKTAIALALLIGCVATSAGTAAELLSIFENDRALYGGTYSLGRTRLTDQNVGEQAAQSFTLSQASRIFGFELVLLQASSNVDSFNLSLTRSSAMNPGGTAPEIGNLAPDLDQVIESWHFDNSLDSDRTLFHIDSIVQPMLFVGEMFWIALTAGRPANAGEVIDIGWVAGDIPLNPASNFAYRGNYIVGGDINNVAWTTGSGQFRPEQAGHSLRVLGEPAATTPEPATLALVGAALLGIAATRRRPFRSTQEARSASR